jgi:Na+/H+ antiporter NhaC
MKGLAAFVALVTPRIVFLAVLASGDLDMWEKEVGADLLLILIPSTSVILAWREVSPLDSLTAGVVVLLLTGFIIDAFCYWVARKGVGGHE